MDRSGAEAVELTWLALEKVCRCRQPLGVASSRAR
jgi:hypothetical protein